MWGGKRDRFVILRFPLVLQYWGGLKIPRCLEKQHEKCHRHTSFSMR